MAGGIVGGIASRSCWRLRGEPRAVDSLAVDRRTACMGWCLGSAADYPWRLFMRGWEPSGPGGVRGASAPRRSRAWRRPWRRRHVRGSTGERGHPTVSTSIVCSYPHSITIAMQARNCSSQTSNALRVRSPRKLASRNPKRRREKHDSEKHTIFCRAVRPPNTASVWQFSLRRTLTKRYSWDFEVRGGGSQGPNAANVCWAGQSPGGCATLVSSPSHRYLLG